MTFKPNVTPERPEPERAVPCPQTRADSLTVSGDLLYVGGVSLGGGVAFSGGETLLIGARTTMMMMMMRKAAAASVTGG